MQPFSAFVEGAEADSFSSPLFTFEEAPSLALSSCTENLRSAVCPLPTGFLFPLTHAKPLFCPPMLHIKINPEVLLQWCSTINKFLQEYSYRSPPSPTNRSLQEKCDKRSTSSANIHLKITTGILHHKQVPTWEHL